MAHHHSHHHHGHAHKHHDKPASQAMSSVKALWFAVVIIFIYALIEALFGWHANSLALLSDAGHML